MDDQRLNLLALDKPGLISGMQENKIDGIEYVYNIEVKLIGAKFSNPYHPKDIKEGKIVNV